MPRFRLLVEYDGRPYFGWQRQAQGDTVQQTIETAVFEITQERAAVHAAGRTDAGVHASGMVAHVHINKPFADFRLMEAVNARLRHNKASASILDCTEVPEDFHARFSCIGRAYEYRIICRRAPLTHQKGLMWRRPNPLDISAMRDAAQHLLGLHDFTTFRHVHCQSASPVKTLDRLDVEHNGEMVVIHAAARSFLHHQVRSMVGTLVLVGEGRYPPDAVKTLLEKRDRTALWLNAPPDGLWFVDAVYP